MERFLFCLMRWRKNKQLRALPTNQTIGFCFFHNSQIIFHMISRKILFAITIFFLFGPSTFAHRGKPDLSVFTLEREPIVRIGLLRNSNSVRISTRDSSLVSAENTVLSRLLDTKSIRLLARGYSPPTFEEYRIQIPNIKTRSEADLGRCFPRRQAMNHEWKFERNSNF